MDWVALTAIGSFIAAIGGLTLGILSYAQKNQESGAKETATMAQTGVELIKEANARQEGYIVRLTGELGQALGALAECKDERHLLMAENRELKADNAAIRAEMDKMKVRLEAGGL